MTVGGHLTSRNAQGRVLWTDVEAWNRQRTRTQPSAKS